MPLPHTSIIQLQSFQSFHDTAHTHSLPILLSLLKECESLEKLYTVIPLWLRWAKLESYRNVSSSAAAAPVSETVDVRVRDPKCDRGFTYTMYEANAWQLKFAKSGKDWNFSPQSPTLFVDCCALNFCAFRFESLSKLLALTEDQVMNPFWHTAIVLKFWLKQSCIGKE